MPDPGISEGTPLLIEIQPIELYVEMMGPFPNQPSPNAWAS